MMQRHPSPLAALLLVATAWPTAAWAQAVPAAAERRDDVTAHLLAGVRAFRADRHEEALREFRVVERAGGSEDLALYLGPTLYKLARFDEARAVLARAHRGPERDAVTDYYLGLTYYRLGLARLARGIFSAIDAGSAGPKLAAGASRFVVEIDGGPPARSIADLLGAAQREASPDAALDLAAEVWLRSAPGSEPRAQAAAVLVRVAEAAHAALYVVDLTSDDAALPLELRLAIARLAVAAGAPSRARPLIDDVRRRGEGATRAAAEEMARGRL